jgi:hypothetical protein
MSFSSVLSPDAVVTCQMDTRAGTPVRTEPARAPSRQRFELRCAEIHAVGCNAMLRAACSRDVVAVACEHGAVAHGFTGVWYGPKRLAVIAAAVTQRP